MSRIFRGGVPTGPDVALLMALDPQPGASVSYEEIEAAIGCDHNSPRFRTVTTAWRKRLFHERLLQSVAQGGAFLFLTPEQAHDRAVFGFARLGRATGRVLVKAEAIDRRELPEAKARQHDLLRRELHLVRETMVKATWQINPPKPAAGAGRLAPALPHG